MSLRDILHESVNKLQFWEDSVLGIISRMKAARRWVGIFEISAICCCPTLVLVTCFTEKSEWGRVINKGERRFTNEQFHEYSLKNWDMEYSLLLVIPNDSFIKYYCCFLKLTSYDARSISWTVIVVWSVDWSAVHLSEYYIAHGSDAFYRYVNIRFTMTILF